MAAQWQERSLESPQLQDYIASQGTDDSRLPVNEWGLPELTLAAFFYHPDLDLARAQWQGSRAAHITATQKQNPTLNTSAEHHSKASGISPWTLGIGLDFTIETGGKREARMEHADSLSEAARLEIGQVAWQVRSRLRTRLLDQYAAQRRGTLLQQEVAVRSDIAALLEARFSAGLISDAEVGTARLNLQKAKAALDSETSRIPELQAALAAAVGLPDSALIKTTIKLSNFDMIVNADILPAENVQRAALLNRLDIRASLARYAAAEAKLKLEIAKQLPDVTLAPGYSFDQGDNRWGLGLSLALALLNKNEGPIAEARAQREVEARQFVVLQTQVIGEQEQALTRYYASLEELGKAGKLRSAIQTRSKSTGQQFEAGFIDRLELVSTRLEEISAEQSVFAALIKAQHALGALEDAVQQPLDGSVPLPDLSAVKESAS